jgi:hypothetical protein
MKKKASVGNYIKVKDAYGFTNEVGKVIGYYYFDKKLYYGTNMLDALSGMNLIWYFRSFQFEVISNEEAMVYEL